jgi:hypothetical protein
VNTEKSKRILQSIRGIPHKRFVLHGSQTRSNVLLPNRPKLHSFKNKRKVRGLQEKAVYATTVLEVAIIYATLPHDTQWKFVRKGRYFHIRWREEVVTAHAGYIHVCLRTHFGRGALTTRSKKAVKVVRTYRIQPEELVYLWQKKAFKFLP